ncbi:MAG TPA: type II CAAX endopeptidase family protein [Abditibacteriaceae bacterium]|jgi:membrane protease YdiL (CAAX protease family)
MNSNHNQAGNVAEQASYSASPASQKAGRRLRVVELLLVLSVAFALPLYSSFYALLTGAPLSSRENSGDHVYSVILFEMNALAVMAYVLFRQGRSWRELGWRFSWKDPLIAIGLCFVAEFAARCGQYLIVLASYAFSGQVAHLEPKNIPNFTLSVGAVLFMLINGFCEELIVRAYTISEVQSLTGNITLAVAGSVVFQAAYHLYQGPLVALGYMPLFLVYSLYYVRFKRIMPVAISHVIFDLLALMSLVRH